MRNMTLQRVILAAGFGAAMLFAAPAMAAPAACITDAELDAAVGDQVRSGVFAINTSMLREAPMCSALTVAQAIQRIAEANSPRNEPPPPPQPDAVSPDNGAGTGPNLDSFLRFSQPSQCDFGPALSTFKADLMELRGTAQNSVLYLGKVTVPPGLAGYVGKPQLDRTEEGLSIRVPIRGQWLGIPVIAINPYYWNSGAPGGLSIVMKGNLQDIRARLNRAGFNIPASGIRIIPGDLEGEMELAPYENEMHFSCSY